MSESTERSSALAAVRGRAALRDAGLDPTVPLDAIPSVTNEVWLTPDHVVRVNATRSQRLARESRLAAALPASVRYPRVVAHGTRLGEEWSVSERVPGRPLAHLWPELSVAARRSAVTEVATMLAALHQTEAPANLPLLEGAPQPLAAGSADPTRPVLAALDRASRLEHVDRIVVAELVDLVERNAPALGTFPASTLVHGDLTFENVLWHDEGVSALLDLEWSRPGPPDLDLDILLRMCAHPQLHVALEHAARTTAEQYAQVPFWLADSYPALFAERRLADRLRLYAVAFNVRELLLNPPTAPSRELPELHPYRRLERLLSGRSHLDDLELLGLFDARPVA